MSDIAYVSNTYFNLFFTFHALEWFLWKDNKMTVLLMKLCFSYFYHFLNAHWFQLYLFDVILGCDGAHSAVRRHMLQSPGFDFSQTNIDHGYIELYIPLLDGKVFNLYSNLLK